KKYHHNVWHTIKKEIAATILGIYSFFMMLSLISLFIFHVWAVATNQTTNEIIKNVYGNKVNPYNKGVVKNFCIFLCEFTPSSRVAGIRVLQASTSVPSPKLVNSIDRNVSIIDTTNPL